MSSNQETLKGMNPIQHTAMDSTNHFGWERFKVFGKAPRRAKASEGTLEIYYQSIVAWEDCFILDKWKF